MQRSFTYYLILLFTSILPFLFPSLSLQSEENNKTQTEQFYLKNGLKVILQPTDFEPDNLSLQLFSMGGFASYNSDLRPSARLAAEIAWESGIDDRTADQLSCDLYDDSIDFEIKIQPFDRFIEASCPTISL